MLHKTRIALAAALLLGTASAALAADSGENNMGGSVMPGSSVGVNPADHRNNPAVQSLRPLPRDNGIRTEGRGAPEDQQEHKKDPQDPGRGDSK
jgi:hypothetical protein